jgi:DNA-binding response OmpR family regulator
MQLRILCVGTDPSLLKTRQALLSFRGYDCTTAMSLEVDQVLTTGGFDLVILSVALGNEEQRRVQAKLPAETKALLLQHFVTPDELFAMVGTAVGLQKNFRG